MPNERPEATEARKDAAAMCGLDGGLIKEMSRLSKAYSLAVYGKEPRSSGRALRFYRAMATDHVFRGRVMKWWLLDRKQVE